MPARAVSSRWSAGGLCLRTILLLRRSSASAWPVSKSRRATPVVCRATCTAPQALNVARRRLNSERHLFRQHKSQPLSKDDSVCLLMTDLSIQIIVDNSVSVTTTAAEAAHRRHVATSRLHSNTHVERLESEETVSVIEGLGSDAAVLKAETEELKALCTKMLLGAAAAYLLAASAAESRMNESAPPPSENNQED